MPRSLQSMAAAANAAPMRGGEQRKKIMRNKIIIQHIKIIKHICIYIYIQSSTTLTIQVTAHHKSDQVCFLFVFVLSLSLVHS